MTRRYVEQGCEGIGPIPGDVDAVGPVHAVVASSLYHHLYVGEWMQAYPDALLNLRQHPSWHTRAAARRMGNSAPGKGWLEYIAVRDWKIGRQQVDRMLRWDIERIVLAHGALVERDGRRVLRDAYAWL